MSDQPSRPWGLRLPGSPVYHLSTPFPAYGTPLCGITRTVEAFKRTREAGTAVFVPLQDGNTCCRRCLAAAARVVDRWMELAAEDPTTVTGPRIVDALAAADYSRFYHRPWTEADPFVRVYYRGRASSMAATIAAAGFHLTHWSPSTVTDDVVVDNGEPCPHDPDGLHHVGCGCEG